MKVLYFKPGTAPDVLDIKHDLKTMQELVGGPIQAIYPFDDHVALVCDDEGKLGSALPNRPLYKDGMLYDIIFGPFFICGLSEESFDDIPEDLIEKYTDYFGMAL